MPNPIYIFLPVVEEHWQESLLIVRLLLERCHICLSSVIRHLTWFFKGIRMISQWYQAASSTCLDMSHPVVLNYLQPTWFTSPLFIPPTLSLSLSLLQISLGGLRAELVSEGWERGSLECICSSSLQHSLIPAAPPHFSWSMWNCQCACSNLSHCLLISQNSQF